VGVMFLGLGVRAQGAKFSAEGFEFRVSGMEFSLWHVVGNWRSVPRRTRI